MLRAAFLAGSAASAAVASVPVAALAASTFAADVLRGELDALWNAMLAVGPAPFLTSDQAQVEAHYRRVRASLDAPLDVRAFWLRVAPVFAALNDGHVAILPPFATPAIVDVPLQLGVDGDDVIVVACANGAIPPGSRLVALEDMPAAEFRDRARRMVGAQSPALHDARVLAFSRLIAYALFGPRPAYAARWIAPDGRANAARLPAAHHVGGEGGEPYAYRTLSGGDIGYIDYRACEDGPRFRRFLAQTFAAIRERPIRALAIDVRENGGGDAALNDDLWSYLTTRPFKQVGSTISRVGDRLKREYGHARYVAEFGSDAWDAPAGTLVRYDFPFVEPGPNPLRFSGPVYLLIGPKTFSSAMGCAIAAKDFGLATVVGEETGEPVNGTGELYVMRVPATRLVGAFPTKVFVPPKPQPPGQGVVPDIVVKTTRADIVAGRDPVLERVLREAKAQMPP